MKIRMGCHALLFTLALLTVGVAARGDMVILKDGRTFEGRIIRENDEQVIMDTLVSGIHLTAYPLNRVDIVSIERKALPADFWKSVDTPAAADPKKPDAKTIAAKEAFAEPPPAEPAHPHGTPYIEIPLVGEFGQDIFPDGIADALAYAAERPSIKHIVFTIDSYGGAIWAAEPILDLLAKYEDRFKYHIIVKKAISASIWAVFACDTIHLTDGCTVGGAVVYKKGTSASTGNVEVDAKMNGILYARVASAAEKKGHPAELVKPMMILGATVAAWRDTAGKVQLAINLPRGVDPGSVLFENKATEILTLTKQQAVEVGLGQSFKGDAKALGDALNLRGWNEFNEYGQWAMRRSVWRDSAIIESLKHRRDLIIKIQADLKEAQDNNPGSSHFTYYTNSAGKFTFESHSLWAKQSGRTIDALVRVEENIKAIQAIDKEVKPLGVPPVQDLDTLSDHVERDLKSLRSSRDKSGP